MLTEPRRRRNLTSLAVVVLVPALLIAAILVVVAMAGNGAAATGRLGRLALLCNVALLGGALLAVASDQLAAGPGRRVLFGVFLGAVMAHFVIDAGLWRLREPFPRTFLTARLPYLLAGAGAAT